MIDCPYCGGRHSNDVKFCPVNGHILQSPLHTEVQLICWNCGNPVPRVASFCPVCGISIQQGYISPLSKVKANIINAGPHVIPQMDTNRGYNAIRYRISNKMEYSIWHKVHIKKIVAIAVLIIGIVNVLCGTGILWIFYKTPDTIDRFFLVKDIFDITPHLQSESLIPQMIITNPNFKPQEFKETIFPLIFPTLTLTPSQPTLLPSIVKPNITKMVPTYYPYADCAPSRLHVGDRGRVSLEKGRNGVRSYADTHPTNNIIGYMEEGEKFRVISGPECNYGWILWKVRADSGLEGWTPEISIEDKVFWLEPLTP